MPLVNGIQADTGCYVDGHWGQYGPDHLAEHAAEFGWEPVSERDDPRYWRCVAEDDGDFGDDTANPNAWENHAECADDIEQWLNDHTPSLCADCGEPVAWMEAPGLLGAVYGRWVHVEPCGGTSELCRNTDVRHFHWHWTDGEFFLSELEDDDE